MAIYPSAWGLDYEDVQGLCWLAYKGSGTKGLYQFSNGNTWEVTEVIEVSGFRAVLVKSKEKTVLSFSGTDFTSIEDWINNVLQGGTGLSPYYARALLVAGRYPADVVVGHSLGGGLASYCAVYRGQVAATINPAPLNVNPVSRIPIRLAENRVINYHVFGEAIQVLLGMLEPDIPKPPGLPSMTKVGRVIRVASTGAGMVQKHLLDYLVGFAKPVRMAPGTPAPYLPPNGPSIPVQPPGNPDLGSYLPPANGGNQRIHIVQPGDWLSKIAITYYGDMNKWEDIWKANISQVPNPDLIRPGQRLIIP